MRSWRRRRRATAPPAPQEGGATAMKAASALPDKPMKRAKKAVDFEEADMAAADGLKQSWMTQRSAR